MRHALMFGDLIQDLRTATIVATVALGIGATTVIFSAVHAALLRPFTFASIKMLLLAVALAACGVPAKRALAVQPAAVLRNE